MSRILPLSRMSKCLLINRVWGYSWKINSPPGAFSSVMMCHIYIFNNVVCTDCVGSGILLYLLHHHQCSALSIDRSIDYVHLQVRPISQNQGYHWITNFGLPHDPTSVPLTLCHQFDQHMTTTTVIAPSISYGALQRKSACQSPWKISLARPHSHLSCSWYSIVVVFLPTTYCFMHVCNTKVYDNLGYLRHIQ